MATTNRGSRRKLPPAAVAPIPEQTPAAALPMTAIEAAPALETAHASSDIVLPPEITPEAIAIDIPATPAEAAAPDPDVDPAPAAAPASTTETVEDIKMDATTETNEIADKGQAMFAEANDRAKGAMEKGTRFLSEMTEFGKGNVEAVVESSKIATRGLETMGQEAAAFAKTSWEQSAAAMRMLASAKSPTEFLKLQADYAREAFDTLVAQSSRTTEASLKLAGDVAQPISNRIAIATDKLKVVA